VNGYEISISPAVELAARSGDVHVTAKTKYVVTWTSPLQAASSALLAAKITE